MRLPVVDARLSSQRRATEMRARARAGRDDRGRRTLAVVGVVVVGQAAGGCIVLNNTRGARILLFAFWQTPRRLSAFPSRSWN